MMRERCDKAHHDASAPDADVVLRCAGCGRVYARCADCERYRPGSAAMSLDDLDAIRVRWAAVTPGLWRRAHHGSHEVEAAPNVLVADCGTEGHARADATAIAHAPADIAALLQLVEDLEHAASQLRREAEYDRSISCENTPWPGCECPGCSTARELAKEGR